MNSILLVDDDILAHEMVKKSLKNTFTIASCFTLNEARSCLSQPESPVLILLDRLLPDGDGLDLCSEVRAHNLLSSIPIIFISGSDKESDKLSGFYAGADDYIAKPFSALELKARVQARLRHMNSSLSFGNVSVDLDKHAVRIQHAQGAVPVNLTHTEYKLLVALLKNRDRVLTREVLLSQVWDHGFSVSDRVVDTHLSHLRSKLAASEVTIECLRGIGYRLILNSVVSSKAA